MDHAHRGEAALAAGQNAQAISHYTQALAASPTAATYYIKRSTAYQRTSQPLPALSDAEIAVALAVARGKRELIAQAQLRRAIALFQLERYGDANFVFGLSKKLDAKEKSIGIWEAKVEGKLRGLDEGHVGREVTVQEVPDVKVPEAGEKKEAVKNGETREDVHTDKTDGAPAENAAPIQTPASKIRHEWYQSEDKITVTLFAKGVPKDQTTVAIEPQSLSISFPLATGSTFDILFDPLFSKVDPSSSTSRILSTKVEIVLKKATPGLKWQDLESQSTSATNPSNDTTASTQTQPTPNSNSGPSYPTSARSGPKNWEKIAQTYSQKHKKPRDADDDSKASKASKAKKDGSGDEGEENDEYVDDFEDGDPVNGFFKKLYAGASDETKRAMMKSYQESNGTALSTNWEEVGKGKVETSPPDGMEAKQWGE